MGSTQPYPLGHECYGFTVEECVDNTTPWEYRPTLALNALLTALFGLCALAHLVQGIMGKTWGFAIAMTIGCIVEVIGYIGRIMAHNDMIGENPFLIQIICLTFAPAFLAAGIYLCLSRIVIVFGADISRIPPKWYTYLFVTCDFFSLILQSAGGGLAATAVEGGTGVQTGTNVMIAGLAFQVFTILVFMILCAEYAWRVRQRVKSGGQLDPVHAKLRTSKRFIGFLIALALSTICIQIRSIFRVIEMAAGWDGPLMANETLFFVLEGVMVAIAVLVLNVFHPGYCFADGYKPGVKKDSSVKSDTTYGRDSEVELGNFNNRNQPMMTSTR